MIEFIALIAGLIFGGVVGWKLRELLARRIVQQFQNRVTESIQEAAKRIIYIQVSKESGQYFVHNKKTGEFMTQGSTREEVAARLGDLFPDMTFIAHQENLKEVGFTNGPS